ncbi:MAG: hypothetical protein INH41_14995, partial [Myxococcaceae bacterium]|nr:hypothetical protein [Myxococcaceae bacterium]
MNVKLIDQRRTADLETPGTPESIQIAQLRYAKGVGVGTVAQANGVTAYVAPALVQERAKASFGTKGVETGHGPSKDAAAAQELSRHLTALFDSPAARDGSLTWSEVVDMATRLKNPSAQWLMDNSDVFKALPTKTGKQGELGIDVAAASAQLSKGLVTPPAQRSTDDARLGQTSEQTATPPKTARQQALDTNAQIERENGELDKEIDKKTKLKDALLKVTTHGLAGDAYLSRQELRDLLQSSDLAQREAAEMVLKQWDQLPVKKYTDWGGGMNTNEMRDAAMKLAGEIDELKARKRELVPVPAEPAATSGSSETNPGKPGGSNRPEAGSGTGDAKRPDQSTTASTGATENYDKIGA